MDLGADFYEPVVYDYAVTKIGFVALAGLSDFIGERLCVAMTRLQVSFCGLGVGESGHDGFPFKQAITPETAHSKNGQLLELSGWLRTEPEGPARPQGRCPQGLHTQRASEPARGLCGLCGLDRRDGSLLLSFL